MAGKLKPILAITLGGAVLLAAGSWGGNWLVSGRFETRTGNAYVAGDIVAIAPRVAGHVKEVMVGDNVIVKAGDVLFRIDDGTYRAAVAEAEAAVAQAEAAIAVNDAQHALQLAAINQAQASHAEAEARLDHARTTYDRYDRLARSQTASVASIDAARSTSRNRRQGCGRPRQP